jgi:hypothetical protein
MKKSLKNGLWILMAGSGLLFSCHKDLNLTPTNEGSANFVYRDAAGYKLALSRVYSAMAVTGNSGPAGDADVPLGGDEGFSDFFRGFWNMQELTTDEAVVAWGDAGLPDFHNMSWTPNNGFIQRGYNRSYFQITLCNEFIRESDPEKLSLRGINDPAQKTEIGFYREEARFLRAFQYWVLLDLFRNVPLVTEKDLVGTTLPKAVTPEELFTYIEKELQSLETSLLPSPAAGSTYGRATRGAAQALLARLYLNAETYLGEGKGKYDKALEYAEKVIKTSGHSINVNANDYHRLMNANNNTAPMNSEFIFTINYDGLRTKGYGGTHYFVHASIGGTMNARMWGTDGGWAGLRTTRNIPLLFPDTGRFGDNGADRRAMFFTTNQSLEINNVTTFQEGFAVTKYRNVVLNSIGNSDSLAYSRDSIYFRTTTAGIRKGDFIKIDFSTDWFLNGTYAVGHITSSSNNTWLVKVKSLRKLPTAGVAATQATVFRHGKGNDPDQAFIDIDMPVFRLAEMYLIYAEAHLRGGGGSPGTATDYINILRDRAYGNTNGRITAADLTLNFILDERGRELYWEGHRRTDLIRYNRFTEGTYLWPWKGGVAAGRGVNPELELFPIPLAEITANPNLKQNPGY